MKGTVHEGLEELLIAIFSGSLPTTRKGKYKEMVKEIEKKNPQKLKKENART